MLHQDLQILDYNTCKACDKRMNAGLVILERVALI